MESIGKEVRRSLKLILAQAVLVEDWYYTYACQKYNRENVETPIIKTPKDAVVIPGSFATPKAIAYLMTQKFMMGLPIYFSLIETAKEYGMDPYKYLLYVLKTALALSSSDESWARILLPQNAQLICK